MSIARLRDRPSRSAPRSASSADRPPHAGQPLVLHRLEELVRLRVDVGGGAEGCVHRGDAGHLACSAGRAHFSSIVAGSGSAASASTSGRLPIDTGSSSPVTAQS